MLAIHLLLGFHVFYSLLALLFLRPPNVFASLNLSLSAPVSLIRAAIRDTLTKNDRTIPPHLLGLLTKLNSFDARVIYVRLGHDVLLTCDHCQQPMDYYLYALPSHLLAYVLEMFFISLITSPRIYRPFKKRISASIPSNSNPFISALRIRLPVVPLSTLRKLGVGSLAAASVAEAYYKLIGEVTFVQAGEEGGDPVIMWHDVLFLLRLMYTALLPLIVYALSPPTPSLPATPANLVGFPPMPLTQLHGLTLQTMQALLSHVRLIKSMTPAIIRDEVLSERAAAWGEEQRIIGNAILKGDEENSDSKDTQPESSTTAVNVWKALVDFAKARDGSVNLTTPAPPTASNKESHTNSTSQSGSKSDAVSEAASSIIASPTKRSCNLPRRRRRPVEEVDIQRRLSQNASKVARNMLEVAGVDVSALDAPVNEQS